MRCSWKRRCGQTQKPCVAVKRFYTYEQQIDLALECNDDTSNELLIRFEMYRVSAWSNFAIQELHVVDKRSTVEQ